MATPKEDTCKVTLPDNEWEKLYTSCRVFAEEEYETTGAHRRKRRQCNDKRVKMQTADGKMGEWLAVKYLKSKGLSCTDPDMEIYSRKHKSFDADMRIGKHHIHCKTQCADSASKFGISWVFQAGAKYSYGGHTDPIVASGEGLAIFVKLNKKEKSGTVLGPFRMRDLRTYFKDPKLKHLKGIKICLYWDDIKDVMPYTIEDSGEEASGEETSEASEPSENIES